MKIQAVEAVPVRVPLKGEWRISSGARRFSDYVVVIVHTDEGISGLGEASPVPRYEEESQGSIVYAIRELLGPGILGMDPSGFDKVQERMDGLMHRNRFAKAAIDMALYDIVGKALQVPVYQLLGGLYRQRIPLAFVTGIKSFDEARQDIEWARANGFKTYKVKVGRDLHEDIELVGSIRKLIGDDLELTVDANAGWNVKQAIDAINRLDEFNLGAVEQPVQGWNLDGLLTVKNSVRPAIMADESVFDMHDAMAIVKLGAADIFNTYIAKTGSIRGNQKVVAVAEAAGIPCLLGGMVELGIGSAVGLHFVAGHKNVCLPNYVVGTLMHADDVIEEQFKLVDGCLEVPHGTGLGITLSQEKLKKYTVS
jgi:L-alanine-DL-glutamate epimerase-like enolase superfamily enzyme